MPTREKAKRVIWAGLKRLADAGVKIQPYMETTDEHVDRDIKAIKAGRDFYLALNEPAPGIGFGFHSHDVLRKPDGLPVKVCSSASKIPYVTLEDQATYYFCRQLSDIRDDSVRENLATRGHVFNVESVKRLYRSSENSVK